MNLNALNCSAARSKMAFTSIDWRSTWLPPYPIHWQRPAKTTAMWLCELVSTLIRSIKRHVSTLQPIVLHRTLFILKHCCVRHPVNQAMGIWYSPASRGLLQWRHPAPMRMAYPELMQKNRHGTLDSHLTWISETSLGTCYLSFIPEPQSQTHARPELTRWVKHNKDTWQGI